MSYPRYAVALHEGRVIMTPLSGLPATEEEVAWIKDLITASLRSRNFVNSAQKPLRFDDDGSVQGVNFEIDPIVQLLVAERRRRNLPVRDIASALTIHPTMISNYSRGKVRPPIGTLRSWAFLLDHDLMAIPRAIRKRVKEMITDWEKSGRPTGFEANQRGVTSVPEAEDTEPAAA